MTSKVLGKENVSKIRLLSITAILIIIINFTGITCLGVNNPVFELQILGARYRWFRGSCPPNQSLTEPCTWDATYHTNLFLRLTYNGNVTCNITSLKVWQELNVKNVVYNHTGPIYIPAPPYSLKKGYFYEFKAEGIFYSQSFGNITVEITTLELGKFIVSTGYYDLSVLSLITSWEPQTPIRKITFSIVILIISFLLFGLRRERKRR